MASIDLWIGGDAAISSLPQTGDTVLRDFTDPDISVAWPSDRLPMGVVHPYYICATSRRRASSAIGTRKIGFKFANMPTTLNSADYVAFNLAIAAHLDGTFINRAFTVDVALDGSHHSNSVTLEPYQSVSVKIPVSELSTTPAGIFFTVKDVPDTVEMFIAINGLMITDSAPEPITITNFNADTWLSNYVKDYVSASSQQCDKIANFVNWPQSEPITSADNSDPISPIGFPAVNTSGVPNSAACDTPYAPGVENPPFVSHSYGVKYNSSDVADTVFRVNTIFSNGKFYVPVERMQKNGVNFVVTISGDFTPTSFSTISFVASPGANITGTNLPENLSTISDVSYDPVSASTSFTVPVPPNCTVENVPRGMTRLEITMQDGTMVSLTAQDNGENGVFTLSENALTRISSNPQDIIDGTMQPVAVQITDFSDPEKYPYADSRVYDNVWACNDVRNVAHFRKGYNDREVFDFVQEHASGIYRSGVLSDNDTGPLINWFLYPGTTSFANGHGSVTTIQNFGLGSSYAGLNGETISAPQDDGSAEPLHPVMRWGYGTSRDAVDSSTNRPALPLDWPFFNSSFANTANNNSITLLREHAQYGFGTKVGGLDYDVTDEHGTTHYEANRHVITIYNDLGKKNPSDQSSATKTIKPTFIHLPTPLSTKDGATCEIEVALENLNYQDAFNSGLIEDLSGYYAFIGQPRVYVCSGFQEFVTTRYAISDYNLSGAGFYLTTSDTIRDANNEPIVHDPTQPDNEQVSGVELPVRARLVNNAMTPSEVWVDGIATASTLDGPTTITVDTPSPWSITDRRFNPAHISVCGVVFVRLNAEIDPENTSDVNTGLRTRTANLIGQDGGTGEAGSLQQYHQFFSLHGDSNRTAFPEGDKRYLVATVYQGSTNTFKWKLGDRKKLASMKESMTMWADSGIDSITDRAWNANYALIHHGWGTGNFDDFSKILCTNTVLGFNVDDMPLSYADNIDPSDSYESAIARRLRIKMPAREGETVTDAAGNPVRQAAKAYRQLIDDYSKLRLRLASNPIASDGMQIDVGTEPQQTFPAATAFFGRQSLATNPGTTTIDGVGDEMWLAKLKTLPYYMAYAFFDPACSSASTEWEGFREAFKPYLDAHPCYEDGIANEYSIPNELAPASCSDIGTPGTQYAASSRSVVELAEKIIKDGNRMGNPAIVTMLDDFRRLSETQTVEYGANSIRWIWNAVNSDEFSPVSHIGSLDSTPAPQYITNATVDSLPDSQREFLAADVIKQYAWSGQQEFATFISENIPDEGTPGSPDHGRLAELIKGFLPFRSSGLDRRFYAGTRVITADGAITDQVAYKHYLLEAEAAACGDSGRMNRYICDNFINDPSRAVSEDVNADWLTTLVNTEFYSPVTSLAMPPYFIGFGEGADTIPEFTDQATYTRVYMSFVFSAKLGRWLPTGYRQYPSAFLTPLYGNQALSQTLPTREGNVEIWANPSCNSIPVSYKSLMYLPYGMISPLDINVKCIPMLYDASPYTETGNLHPDLDNETDRESSSVNSPKYRLMTRLRKPYLSILANGLGLSMPCNVHGFTNPDLQYATTVEHANFWSVRKYIRPATGAQGGQYVDIPGREGYNDGSIGSPGLYNMFEWPARNVTEYAMPPTSGPAPV